MTTRQLIWKQSEQRGRNSVSVFSCCYSGWHLLFIHVLPYQRGRLHASPSQQMSPLPFLPGAVFEEVYPGNSGQRSLPVWQVCDGGLTAAVLRSLSLSVFLSPVSPSFQPAAAESSSVCSYVTAAACWFMEHKRLRIDPGNMHTSQQMQHRCVSFAINSLRECVLTERMNYGCLFFSPCLPSLLCFVHR